jgi:hypothetical protein
MDGPATGTVEGHDALGRFTKRHGEYAAKKRRLAALVVQLTNDYDVRSATARQLIEIASRHLDQAATTRNNAIRARATRLATRLLDRLERKPQQKLTAFDEYVAKMREHEAAK